MEEIRRIVQECKEAIEEAGCEYKREQLKIHAFDEIVAEIEAIDQINKMKRNKT